MVVRPLTSAETEWIESIQRAYRAMWSKLKNVPHRGFAGSRDDISALDFIDYEAGHHPEGLVGAAVIWGGVLAATGLLSWAIGDEQHLVLVGDADFPKALIFPYARVAEINHSSGPRDSKFAWLLEEAVLQLDCVGFSDGDMKKLTTLLDDNSGEFFDFARRGVERIERNFGIQRQLRDAT